MNINEEGGYLYQHLQQIDSITFPPLCKHKCTWGRKAWEEAYNPVAVHTLQLLFCVYDEWSTSGVEGILYAVLL